MNARTALASLRTALAVLLAGAGACAAAASLAVAPAAAGAGDTLVVGMAYLEPAHAPGAKVRTAEPLEIPLAGEIAGRVGAEARPVFADPLALARAPSSYGARIGLASVGAASPAPEGAVRIPTGYEARPMAIMRTDTDIKSWRQLAGRTVCLAEGSVHVGRIAAQYGATEMIYPSTSAALIGVRTGECDAGVHDDRFLEELIKFPEWKKFSAALRRGGEPHALVVVADANDEATIGLARELAAQWKRDGYFGDLLRKRAHEIAFEVYLDQEVVDCH